MFLKRYFKGIIFLVLSSLNKLDAATKGAKRFSNPQALSSALAVLRTLQPRAFGLLNCLVPLVLASNYYLVFFACSLPGYSLHIQFTVHIPGLLYMHTYFSLKFCACLHVICYAQVVP